MGSGEITLGIEAKFSEINGKQRNNGKNRDGIQRDKCKTVKYR